MTEQPCTDFAPVCIVAVCLWNYSHYESWLECKQSIRDLHPDLPIIAVLDSSSYIDIRPEPLLTIIKSPDNVASDMVLYDVFNMSKYNIAITLQDSMRLKHKIDFTIKNIQYLWHFANHRIHWSTIKEPESEENKQNNIKTHDDLVLYCIDKHATDQFKLFAKHKYWQKYDWVGCFGCLSIITKDYLRQLDSKTNIISIMKQMGRDNRKRRAIESIFSLANVYMGIDLISWDGLYLDDRGKGHGLNGEKIAKVSHNRDQVGRPDKPMIVVTGDSHTPIYYKIPFVTEHWIGFYSNILPVTMHRLGKEGYNLPTISQILGNGHEHFPIKPGDTVIYNQGYNDVQYNICEQIALGRTEDEVLTTLVNNYVKVLLENEQKYKVFTCIPSIPPPPCIPIKFETKGTAEERAKITIRLNKMLQEECNKHGFKYLDIYSRIVDENGLMGKQYTEDGSHLLYKYEYIIIDCLRQIFNKNVCSIQKDLKLLNLA